MYQFAVKRESGIVSDSKWIRDIVLGLESCRARPGKIYSMEIGTGVTHTNPRSFVFQTTSKDVFLGLGALYPEVQFTFAALLQEQFSENNCSELLCTIEGSTMLVTKTLLRGGETLVFTIAPAH